jgi:acyl dehydratase
MPDDTKKPLYLDDLHVGQRFISDTYQIEEDRMKTFAAEFDPQPFHLDENAAQRSIFKSLAASGWYTAAISMGLIVRGPLRIANGIIGLGVEAEWPAPTHAGDTLRVESEVIEITPSRSKPNRAVVRVRSTTLNQDNAPVQIAVAKLLVFRRP